MRLLVGLKANVNSKSSTQGLFALSMAAREGQTEVVEFLVDCKADIDMVSSNGEFILRALSLLILFTQGTLL